MSQPPAALKPSAWACTIVENLHSVVAVVAGKSIWAMSLQAKYCHCLGGPNVAVMAMLADIIDQHALKTGHVQTGIFYSARTFFAKASQSASNLIAGLALMHVVGMPIGAVPGQLGQDVLIRLGWTYALGSTGALIAVFFYFQYRLSKDDHARIREELESRQAAPPAHNVE